MLGWITVYFETLMCCTVFFIRVPRRKYFAARFLLLALLTGILLYWISPYCAYQAVMAFIYYVIEFCLILAMLHFSFRIDWWRTLYFSSAGWATQHIAYQILRLVQLRFDLFDWLPSGFFWEIMEAFLSYLPFCVLAYFMVGRRVRVSHWDPKQSTIRKQMSVISVVTVLICIGITRFAKSGTSWPAGTVIAESLYAIVCCALCLIMQFELIQHIKLNKEMEMVRMLWKEDSKQLAERKATIEMINIKCHDIRHKLEDYHLPLTADEEAEIKSLIQIYDQSYRTGNHTLDVLLADRMLLCEKDHIQLSFLGNGQCLNFLTEEDIFSLFSNALGNAIDACQGLEREKRQISIIVKSSGDLVSISVTNYYQGVLRFEDDLPVTTRLDEEDFHGYGMKSMRTIAQKYGGRLKVKAEDGVFNLTIWLIGNQVEQIAGISSNS